MLAVKDMKAAANIAVPRLSAAQVQDMMASGEVRWSSIAHQARAALSG